jgi:3-oxoacyl-[acyl-carrier protein] reductase
MTLEQTSFRLDGRHALVTGSTSGIGAATARLLARHGAHVVVTGRDRKRGEAVVAEICEQGGQSVFVPSDLAAPPAALRTFAEAATAAAGGRLDLLVHNAAVCPAVDTLGLADDDLEMALAVNVRAPHVLTAALVPAMVEAGHGTIVTIGSWMSQVGSPFVGLYSATKAAQEQLTRSWAAEFGPLGVRCVTVSPGVTRTPINEGSGDILDKIAAGTPAGRTVHPEAIARAVAWLASEDADFVHGATLAVDGGISTTRLG